jgi:hypothetical protein
MSLFLALTDVSRQRTIPSAPEGIAEGTSACEVASSNASREQLPPDFPQQTVRAIKSIGIAADIDDQTAGSSAYGFMDQFWV